MMEENNTRDQFKKIKRLSGACSFRDNIDILVNMIDELSEDRIGEFSECLNDLDYSRSKDEEPHPISVYKILKYFLDSLSGEFQPIFDMNCGMGNLASLFGKGELTGIYDIDKTKLKIAKFLLSKHEDLISEVHDSCQDPLPNDGKGIFIFDTFGSNRRMCHKSNNFITSEMESLFGINLDEQHVQEELFLFNSIFHMKEGSILCGVTTQSILTRNSSPFSKLRFALVTMGELVIHLIDKDYCIIYFEKNKDKAIIKPEDFLKINSGRWLSNHKVVVIPRDNKFQIIPEDFSKSFLGTQIIINGSFVSGFGCSFYNLNY